MSEKDIKDLASVRKFLIDLSKYVYRDYKFFFQAENVEQRRVIYNEIPEYEEGKRYSIVCKSLCEIVKNELQKTGIEVEIIGCDTDEFGHYDILVNGKYIINCLSDLERTQLGMKPKRFASKKYCEERYSNLIDKLCFLTEKEMSIIDGYIGYKKDVYLDDALKLLKVEFNSIEKILAEDEYFRETYINDSKKDINKETLLKAKLDFLIKHFDIHGNIIGYIEFVRIIKLFIKELFKKEDLKYIKCYNCFVDDDLMEIGEKRNRFLCIEVHDSVYLLSHIKNNSQKFTKENFIKIKEQYNICMSEVVISNENIAEVLRNKGIGVNILKHFIVKNYLNEINDLIMHEKTEEEFLAFLKEISDTNEIVSFTDKRNNNYMIILSEDEVTIAVNEKVIKYRYESDKLVSDDGEFKISYKWIDEGNYEQRRYKSQK